MQAVYSLWDYVPLKKYRTYGIFPHFFVHEYAAIVSTSKKNTEHTVHVHKIPYIRYFLTFFLCTTMLELCPSQRKIPNIRYMSIIVWIIAPTPVHIRTADCVHLGKMPYIRYISTCVWILPAPCRRCIHSGNCVYLKKYRTYGIFPQWFGLLHQYQYAAIVSISKNTEHTVVMYILVLIIAPAPYIYCKLSPSRKYRTYGVFP